MDNEQKHRLGHRAFILFLLKRIKFSIFLFVLTGVLWYSQRFAPLTIQAYVIYGTQLFLLISIAYFLMIFIRTWLEYRFYTYMFTDEAFMMSSGYMVRSEGAALYHQIQNVNIERGPWDRMAGVSKVVIFLAGSEASTAHNKIVLPAVGKKKAKLVQKELLVRARRHTTPPSAK